MFREMVIANKIMTDQVSLRITMRTLRITTKYHASLLKRKYGLAAR